MHNYRQLCKRQSSIRIKEDSNKKLNDNNHNQLKKYPQITKTIENSTLHWVTMYGNIKEAELLLEQKATDVNQKNHNGSTALHIAIKEQKIDFVSLLLEKGANLNAEDNYGYYPDNYIPWYPYAGSPAEKIDLKKSKLSKAVLPILLHARLEKLEKELIQKESLTEQNFPLTQSCL